MDFVTCWCITCFLSGLTAPVLWNGLCEGKKHCADIYSYILFPSSLLTYNCGLALLFLLLYIFIFPYLFSEYSRLPLSAGDLLHKHHFCVLTSLVPPGAQSVIAVTVATGRFLRDNVVWLHLSALSATLLLNCWLSLPAVDATFVQLPLTESSSVQRNQHAAHPALDRREKLRGLLRWRSEM